MTDTGIATTASTVTAPPAAVIAAQPAAPPARAGAISDAHYDGLDLAAQAGYARVRKGPDGGAEWVHRDNLSKEPADGVTGADGVVDPSKITDTIKLRGADGVEFELDANDVQQLMQQRAADAIRKTQVPADPSGYEPRLPQSLKLPEGVEFRIDTTDPALQDFRAWAHKRGLSQDDFSEGLGIFAAKMAREEAVIQTARAGELAKLGANATQRVDAIEKFLRGVVGDELAGPMRSALFTEKIVRGWEKVIHRFASQGAAEFRNHGREPPQPAGRVSDEAYAAMTPSQKVDYARGFPQKQFNVNARDDARR